MRLEEYIKRDLPFNHITQYDNKLSILEKGLLNGEMNLGTCVVRCNDIRVLTIIAIEQLKTSEEQSNRFCVFRLLPSKHGISVKDVARDQVDDPTRPLHNYLKKKRIEVDQHDILIEDIIFSDCYDRAKWLKELNEDGLIVELEY